VSATILLVEDEPALARGISDNLRLAGFTVKHVARGDAALDAVREARPDAIVLDVMLPGRSGFDVLHDLREAGLTVPVVMLTAKGDVVDRVRGLELGADDYVAKPFSMPELLARLKAVLRRVRQEARPAVDALSLAGIHFDFRALTARGPGGAVDLTPHDVLVLKVLANRRGEVVSRLDIIEEVCGLESDATLRTVDNHIVALRKALGEDPKAPRFLHTVRGEGYRLSAPDA
jgi:two-component system alkaline phosphatase synthesis response regulator PhoP